MGRSRRRTQKFKVKVSVRQKKKAFSRSNLPAELAGGRPIVEAKLGTGPTWDIKERLDRNYAANNFLADPNVGFGRNNKAADVLQEKAAEMEQGGDHYESDDDLRQFEGKARRDGKRAEVPKPTTQQRRTIEALMSAHGEDVEGMVKDRKRNPMLLPASKLRRLIAGHKKYGEKGRCTFRVPVKGL